MNKWRICVDWFLVLLVMTAIFFFSAQNGESSGSLSGYIVHMLNSIFAFFGAKLENTEGLAFIVRKGAHVTIYLILAFLTMNALQHSKPAMSKPILWLFTILICVLYAASDEFHQSFSVERGASFTDVLIDAGGAFAGGGVYSLFHFRGVGKHSAKIDYAA